MELKLVLADVTLGEWAAAERASGLSMSEMLQSRTTLLILAMYLRELKNSDGGRSWQELSSLKVHDVSSLMSPSDSIETHAK